MNTDVELFLESAAPGGAEDALERAEAFFRSVEARFSRFLPDSELTRLNEAASEGVRVSPELSELVRRSLAAAEATQGIFDPTLIDALEAAGYDRSFDDILERGTRVRPLPAAVRLGRWQGIRVDPQAHRVTLPSGLRLDLGGIAKGWAADRAAELLRPLGSGMVNAGGDLCAWGDQPDAAPGQGWAVTVDDPFWPGGDVAWLRVQESALATSTIARRRWAGGHHLIDPRTGRPARTDLVSVTVAAPTAEEAEVAAKVVLILGRTDGLAWLARQAGLEALLMTESGYIVTTPGVSGSLAWVQQEMLVEAAPM